MKAPQQLLSNEDVVHDLLKKRQHSNLKLGEFFSNISAKARELGADLKQKIDEEIWKKSLKQLAGSSNYLFDPIIVLMEKPNNPVAELVRDMVSRERSQLITALSADDHITLEKAVQRCLKETDIFIGKQAYYLKLLDS